MRKQAQRGLHHFSKSTASQQQIWLQTPLFPLSLSHPPHTLGPAQDSPPKIPPRLLQEPPEGPSPASLRRSFRPLDPSPHLPAWEDSGNAFRVPRPTASQENPRRTPGEHAHRSLEDRQFQVASDHHLWSYVPWVALHKSPGVEVQGTIFIFQFQAFLSSENRIMQSLSFHRMSGAVSCKCLLAAHA